MRKDKNPFEPGAGTRPPELAGRELILEDAEAAIVRTASGRPLRGQVFYGLRGVGKTVLLRLVSEIATNNRGVVADLEAPDNANLAETLAPALYKITLELSRIAKAKDTYHAVANAVQAFVSKLKIKIGDLELGVEKPNDDALTGDLGTDLSTIFEKLGELAKAKERVIVIALDEIQNLPDDDLSILIAAIHHTNQKALPIGLFGAGLPQVLAKAGKAKSYSERLFQFAEIGALPAKAAARAIREPIRKAGASIDDDAVDYIVEQSRGYPYFLQEWGLRSWNQAADSPISRNDVIVAEDLTIQSLDRGFFQVRFRQLTDAEKDYLRAMAELGPGPHQSGEIAKVLGKQAKQVGFARQRVIAKGMAYGEGRGATYFTVPLFDEFMRREMPDFKPIA